jgi:integrase/recombinase XerD
VVDGRGRLRGDGGRHFDGTQLQTRGSLSWVLKAWLDDLETHNYSPNTITARREMGLQFVEYCAERDISQASAVTRPLVERYQRHLFQLRTAQGKRLSVNYQIQRISCVQYLFRWAVRRGHVGANPAADIDRPRPVQRLPEHLTSAEIDAVMAVPDTSTGIGLRDRAILEVLYSTGLRRSECAALTVYDINAERGVVRVTQGKGRKDRVVPIGQRARDWVTRYEAGPRADVAPLNENTLFLTDDGRPFQAYRLGNLVRRLLKAGGVTKPGACHLFRHTMATALVEGGCDVRLVQEMLGHVSLETTAIYTHVSVAHLTAAHQACHPAETGRTGPVYDPQGNGGAESSAMAQTPSNNLETGSGPSSA